MFGRKGAKNKGWRRERREEEKKEVVPAFACEVVGCTTGNILDLRKMEIEDNDLISACFEIKEDHTTLFSHSQKSSSTLITTPLFFSCCSFHMLFRRVVCFAVLSCCYDGNKTSFAPSFHGSLYLASNCLDGIVSYRAGQLHTFLSFPSMHVHLAFLPLC